MNSNNQTANSIQQNFVTWNSSHIRRPEFNVLLKAKKGELVGIILNGKLKNRIPFDL